MAYHLLTVTQTVAADANGTVSTTVVRPASITPLTSLSVSSSVIISSVPTIASSSDVSTATADKEEQQQQSDEPDQQNVEPTVDVQASVQKTIDDSAFLGSPASFSVAGTANQAFSIALPASGIILTQSKVIVISGFDHNGGMSPSVSGDGSGSFDVQASFNVDDVDSESEPADASSDSTPADEGPLLVNASFDPGESSNATDGPENGPVGQSRFKFAISTETPHFDIIVSYN